MKPAATTIGFLGLGAIGHPIATRLLQGGCRLAVFDIRPEALEPFSALADIAASPKDVGDRADVVFGCLTSADIHRRALLGPDGLVQGSRVKRYVNLGTTGTALIQELSRAMAGHGIDTIDAPTTGGLDRARNGVLTSITAGAESAVDAVSPLIKLYSSRVFWMGPDIASAQVMKVVNNAVSYANLAAACEALVVGAKAGLDPDTMLDVLNSGSGQNSATLTKIPSDVLTGRFAFGGKLGIVIKDLQAFLEEAEAQGFEPFIGQVVLNAYLAALNAGSDRGDVTEVMRPMEQTAAISVRSTSMNLASLT
ncbi:MAG: NAD(P)-dependent oxidoreductase [Polaromonas sp.]|nr:NAD(P)-dependent oxidoreductase [Polaromonas sp.]